MIKTTELRIGNRYNRKHGKGWTETIITEEIMGKIFSKGKEYALDDFEPILLSPDILKTYGFEKRELPPNYAGGLPGYQICIRKSANRWLMLTGKSSLYIAHINESNSIFEGSSIGSYHALHQIQNLYFDFTGEELEVRL